MTGHYILCGFGKIGAHVLAYLRATGEPVVVIDSRNLDHQCRQEGVTFVQGDCRQRQVLEQAGIVSAAGLLIVTSDDLTNLTATLLAQHLNPGLRVVVRMFNQALIRRLGPAAGNVSVLSTSALAAPVLAMLAQTGGLLGAFVAQGKRQQVAEITVRARAPWHGLALAELARQYKVRLIGHWPAGQHYRLLSEMDRSALLASGDHVLVCGEPAAVALLRTGGDIAIEPELQWASNLIRLWRVGIRALLEVDLSVKICGAILVFVVVGSTLVFHLTMTNDSLPDAFFRTISLMATMADMGLRDLPQGGWHKVYVSALRLTGAALLAAFTAILTNFLLRAHLRGALEVRRIPEGGHIVVCGLGNVGFRVVENLRADGEQVVVVERAVACPFVATARRKKAAVMIADATVAEVLREAHAATARAVIAATDNELANLEIALLAKEINPTQRVILRLADAQLARTLREAAHIPLAVSIPDLAAPAFLAALFGDHVDCVFFVQGRLLAAVRLTVDSAEHPLLGQTPRQLAATGRLLTVAITPTATSEEQHPGEAALALGDRLTAIVELPDLQRLVRPDTSTAAGAAGAVSATN